MPTAGVELRFSGSGSSIFRHIGGLNFLSVEEGLDNGFCSCGRDVKAGAATSNGVGHRLILGVRGRYVPIHRGYRVRMTTQFSRAVGAK